MGAIAIAKASDGVFERLVSGLEGAFGRSAAEGLARHFIEAEGADFYWEARQRERWIGTYERLEEEGEVLDQVAVFGFLDGLFYVAVVLVDAFDGVEALAGLRRFERRGEAERAFESID
ncbi:hypothetical protein E5675_16220 [Sphingopyxis sp. PAMC25046]|uniref:hypothetical protein n=1 Tax=Sphingopyxis sp. PAMC25046 TaxID=2565556 RepID=UPI00109DC875|nr:hypothetical protein [Sphingopyxis sp. PAMC25046]QCB55823.1 hypothetical protein E5675_16220 [Sphingopyxis sp. PAMC25046]